MGYLMVWPFARRDKNDALRINEYNHSNAAFFVSTYGSPDTEKVLPTFQSYATSGYANNAVVFAVMLARLSLFSEATFKFQNLADKRLYGNQDLSKLEHPWPNGTTGELLVRMLQDVDLAGNAYIRDTGTGLERLRPDDVTIVSEVKIDSTGHQSRQVIGYYYDPSTRDRDRDPEFFGVDEVAHWSPIPDPLAEFRGMSWLTPVVREINADSSMTDYKQSYLENSATPNLLIKYSEQIDAPDIAELRNRIDARYGGVGNAFKTLILDQGADATIVGGTFDQMRFDLVQAAGENRIAVAAGVPGIVAGLKEGLEAATYSNYEQAMRRFVDLTIRPLWRSACAALAPLVNVPAGAKLWFDTSDIAALRQGEMERAQTFAVKASTAQTLVNSGYEPSSVNTAIEAGDMSLLVHTGLLSVQLQDPTAKPPAIKSAVPVEDSTDA